MCSEGHKRCKSTLLCPLLFPFELCTAPLWPVPFGCNLYIKESVLRFFPWQGGSSLCLGGFALPRLWAGTTWAFDAGVALKERKKELVGAQCRNWPGEHETLEYEGLNPVDHS